MKGLAEVKDVMSKLPRVRVDSRKARKHYGTECYTPYKKPQKLDDDGHSPERRSVAICLSLPSLFKDTDTSQTA